MNESERAAVLCGVGGWTPPAIVTNDELAAELDTSDEWIVSRTGIRQRHVASHDLATSDLALEAGERALKSAGLADVDAVILATTTPDQVCPATAPQVASRLGLRNVAAFDVAAVCTGFLYALAAGTGMITAHMADRVLVIGAEVFTRLLNPSDKTTRAIFGDGAGAVVLRAGTAAEHGSIGPITLGSDGTGSDLITVPAGGSRRPPVPGAADEADRYFRMNGQPVYRRAVEAMTASSRRVLQMAGLPVSSVDWLVCHQANQRILVAVAQRLGLPEERCISQVSLVGNTAAASIPLALAWAAEDLRFTAGDRILLSAFGGGLTWGSAMLRWPELHGLESDGKTMARESETTEWSTGNE